MVPYRGRGSETLERLTPRLSVHCSLEATQTEQSKETEKIFIILILTQSLKTEETEETVKSSVSL